MEINLNEHFTYGKIIRYTLPNFGTMLAITSFQMIDGFFVSNWLGVIPFAAVNLIFPFIMICAAPGFMIGAGASALISRTKGEGNVNKARQYFTLIFVALLIYGIVFGAIAYMFLPEILVLIGSTEELIEDCLKFGRTIFVFLPCLLTMTAFQSLWVAAEKAKLGFKLSILQGIVIIFFDWLLIVETGFGIEGAAMATVLGNLVFSVITIWYFCRPNSSGLHFVKFDFELKKLVGVCYNGSSEMVDAVSANIVELVMNLELMALVGEIGIAAFGVYSYVNEFFLAIFFALATTTINVVGYKYGAGDFEEIKSIRRKNTLLTLELGVALRRY